MAKRDLGTHLSTFDESWQSSSGIWAYDESRRSSDRCSSSQSPQNRRPLAVQSSRKLSDTGLLNPNAIAALRDCIHLFVTQLALTLTSDEEKRQMLEGLINCQLDLVGVPGCHLQPTDSTSVSFFDGKTWTILLRKNEFSTLCSSSASPQAIALAAGVLVHEAQHAWQCMVQLKDLLSKRKNVSGKFAPRAIDAAAKLGPLTASQRALAQRLESQEDSSVVRARMIFSQSFIAKIDAEQRPKIQSPGNLAEQARAVATLQTAIEMSKSLMGQYMSLADEAQSFQLEEKFTKAYCRELEVQATSAPLFGRTAAASTEGLLQQLVSLKNAMLKKDSTLQATMVAAENDLRARFEIEFTKIRNDLGR